jgi:tetraacyldisaccharide 4'-kinase
VGESRFLAGQLSEQNFGPRLHLLDDGFQHRELSRDFDIVLLTAKDLNDRLFPMGLLREPLSALERAHAIALMDEGMEFEAEPYKLVWRVHRGIRISETPPKQIAFCGIARPQRFFRQLRAIGLEPAAEIAFRDHHHYKARDVERLLRARDRARASGFVTTEKDTINLGALAEKLAPLHVIEVRMELDEPELALEAIQAEIDARARSVA